MATARRFRLRLSRLLRSCRSNDASTAAYRLSSDHRQSFLCDHEPSCHATRRSSLPQEFRWKQEAGFHVVVAAANTAAAPRRKVCSSSDRRWKRRQIHINSTTTSFGRRISSSSGDNGLFSSEEFDEGTALMTDSSSDTLGKEAECRETKNAAKKVKNRNKNKNKKKSCILRNNVKSRRSFSLVDSHGAIISSPARLSAVFRKLAPPCVVMDGLPAAKVRESFAVVKRSACPYEDFRSSMMEMIVEKDMFEEGDLEQLLLCFLSLNSSCHHAAIVAAFSEIWQAIF